jgi:hypothetical protein
MPKKADAGAKGGKGKDAGKAGGKSKKAPAKVN